jgi:hypothetical protein
MQLSSSAGKLPDQGASSWILAPLLFGVLLCSAARCASQSNIPFNGGPIMQTNKVFLIFWLPAGSSYDTSVTGGVGNYETLLGSFIENVSGTTYYSVSGQYSGTCSSNPCFIQNSPGAVTLGGSFVDTRAYAHADGTKAAGTDTDPLLDADIQHEVQTIMTQNHLADDITAEYFVYTASGIQECSGDPASGAECTFVNPLNIAGQAFCAYHTAFTDSSGHNAVYAYMSDAAGAGGGCDEGLAVAPNVQIASDREVALTSHELTESVTDPLIDAWESNGNEIGDNCNQDPGTLQADGSNVALNGSKFAVQTTWSNFTSSCVLGLPSLQLAIGTGSDDLRSDSSATAAPENAAFTSLQTFTLKTQTQPGWNNNTTNQQMWGFSTAAAPQLGAVAITLAWHDSLFESPDGWNIQTIDGKVFDPANNLICQFSVSGNPFVRLGNGNAIVVVDSPGCLPSPPAAEPVSCSVFNDGYASLVGPSDAIFINSTGQACIPGQTSGICRKWFGRCTTNTTHIAVNFNAFDDGYANLTGLSDAVFINGNNQACLPNGQASGTCRRWFGRGHTSDGRSASCIVFGDGYTNQSLPSDAVFVNGSKQSCIPSGTSSGTCQKWFGRCQVH